MRSATFHLISAAVTLLLLLGLALVIRWVAMENSGIDTVPAGRDLVAPEATSASPAMNRAPAEPSAATITSRATSTPTAKAVTSTAIPSSTVLTIAERRLTRTPPATVTISVATSGINEGTNSTRANPTATHTPFTTATAAASSVPASETVSIASAAATVPAPSLVVLSNANYVNDVTLSNGIVWAATDGGVVAWNQQNGQSSKFTSLDGLTHNVATTVIDCPLPGLGVVFGTPNGLQIFSWESGAWRTLNGTNSPMAFDDVAALACDVEAQTLLVGYSQHGVDQYNGAANEWTHIDQNSGLASNDVRAVLWVSSPPAEEAELWVAHHAGVTVVRGEDATIWDAANSPLNGPVVALVEAGDGSIWLAENNALHRITPAETADAPPVWESYDSESAGDGFAEERLVDVAVSPQGTLWLGFESGTLCRFEPVDERCSEQFEPDAGAERAAGPLTSVYVDDSGRLYYTGAGNGYSQLDGGAWQSFVLPDEVLPDNRIHSLVQDADGTVWIATGGGVQRFTPETASGVEGVYPAAPAQFEPFDSSMVSREVQVVAPGADGSMWFGADAVGRYRGGEWSIYTSLNGLAGTPIHAIEIDALDRAWLGTGGGLTIHTQDSLFSLTQAEGLPSDTILALQAVAEDDESMWIGTGGGGLLRVQRNQIQVFNQQNAELPSDVITALAQDADGSLLVGTDRGLARFVNGQTTQIRSVGDVAVTALATSPEGVVWVGTAGSGAYSFNGLAWQHFTTEDHLPSLHITALLVDTNGVAWIGADNGGLLQYYHAGP